MKLPQIIAGLTARLGRSFVPHAGTPIGAARYALSGRGVRAAVQLFEIRSAWLEMRENGKVVLTGDVYVDSVKLGVAMSEARKAARKAHTVNQLRARPGYSRLRFVVVEAIETDAYTMHSDGTPNERQPLDGITNAPDRVVRDVWDAHDGYLVDDPIEDVDPQGITGERFRINSARGRMVYAADSKTANAGSIPAERPNQIAQEKDDDVG